VISTKNWRWEELSSLFTADYRRRIFVLHWRGAGEEERKGRTAVNLTRTRVSVMETREHTGPQSCSVRQWL
jgi:hypothetical protein